MSWWLWVACRPNPAEPVDTGTPVVPSGVLEIVPGDDVVGFIPCDTEFPVRVVNHDTQDHRIDQVRFQNEAGDLRFDEWDIELPQVVRAGGEIVVPLHDAGLVPGPSRGTLTVVTDAGAVSGSFEGQRSFGEARSDTFVVPEPQVDVILAVDQSGNMPGDHAADLADGLDGWFDALSAVADWRLALVHTEDGCAADRVWEEGDPQAADRVGADAFSGPAHPLDEHLLELASRALAENAPTECNASFRREGAQLHVVVVSDEPEQSGRDWSFWVDDFYDYAQTVVVSGIVDEDRRCNTGDGEYDDAIDATGGVSIDLCDAGWSDRLDDLAATVVPQRPEVVVPGGVVPESLVVTVAGDGVPASWDAVRGVVVVEELLPPGTRVQLAWAEPAICAED